MAIKEDTDKTEKKHSNLNSHSNIYDYTFQIELFHNFSKVTSSLECIVDTDKTDKKHSKAISHSNINDSTFQLELFHNSSEATSLIECSLVHYKASERRLLKDHSLFAQPSLS